MISRSLKALECDFPFDAVQMPLNRFHASFHGFQNIGPAGSDPARNRWRALPR